MREQREWMGKMEVRLLQTEASSSATRALVQSIVAVQPPPESNAEATQSVPSRADS